MSAPLTRSVLVTGCSRGLGLEMIRQLTAAENPPQVIIATCRNPDKAAELQALAQAHQQVKIMKLDVQDYGSLSHLASEVKEAVGDAGLNLLVNNAGILDSCPTQSHGAMLDNLEPQMFRNVFETNTLAPLMLIKALLPQLRVAAAAGGAMGVSRAAVINVSSDLASMGMFVEKQDAYAYRASKAAVNMVTRTLASDPAAAAGVLCVSVHPGWVRTDMGGGEAPLSKQESVSQMLRAFSTLKEKHNGLFISYDGTVLQF